MMPPTVSSPGRFARLEASQSLLCIVDVQERLAPAMSEDARARLERGVRLLLKAARQLDVEVVYTEQYPKGLGPTVPWLLSLLEEGPAHRFEKVTFSAWEAPGLAAHCSRLARRDVVLVGMESHVCVYQTARDLLAAGHAVHLPLDAVASRREDHRQAGLELCRELGARISTAETVVFDWLRQSGTIDFKNLAPYLREL